MSGVGVSLMAVMVVMVVMVVVVAHWFVHHFQHRPAAAAAEVAPNQERAEREEDDVEVGGVVPAEVGPLLLVDAFSGLDGGFVALGADLGGARPAGVPHIV